MCQTILLRIRNFGPIREGEFSIDKYMVLIGDQGTGKSTVAKVFSLFTWLEKMLIRHLTTVPQLQQGAFGNKPCNSFLHIESYYRPETEIEYDGQHYRFVYAAERLSVTEKDVQAVEVPKVMYVPAERNILSAVAKPSNIKGWPEALSSFLEEFEKGKLRMNGVRLPVQEAVRFEYDRLNEIGWIAGADYRVRLTAAASGFQSLVPLCLVTTNLSDLVAQAATGTNDLNVSDKLKLQKEVNEVMANPKLSEDVKNAMLQSISARFSYSGFVNVVEEMEQNLYPQSQRDVLYFLLSQCNRMDANRLLLTTHSPYLLNYLAMAVKGAVVWAKTEGAVDESMRQRLAAIVPQEAGIEAGKLSIYELSPDGTSCRLGMPGGIPSDDNLLNNMLAETNDLFNDLLDIEEACQV